MGVLRASGLLSASSPLERGESGRAKAEEREGARFGDDRYGNIINVLEGCGGGTAKGPGHLNLQLMKPRSYSYSCTEGGAFDSVDESKTM